MSIRPFRDIKRKKTKKIKVGKVEVGGNSVISVQSMTNTLTTNVEETVKQINQLEKAALDNLDPDKINDIAECLFVLNNRKYGWIPGAYMVMCTKPGKEWCVGQVNADRAKPFVLFEDKIFSTAEEAQKEAEKIKKNRGESAPRRCT